MAKPTFTDLWELLNYDFETGKLWWKPRDRKWFKSVGSWKAWNSHYANKEAFTYTHVGGYKHGLILRKQYKAHQVTWAMCFGEWPVFNIDHIDGDTANNKIENLRHVSHAENMKNYKRPVTNTSGVSGVSFHKRTKKWQVQIRHNDRIKYIGVFTDFEEAVRVRKQAEIDYGYHPNHGRPGR